MMMMPEDRLKSRHQLSSNRVSRQSCVLRSIENGGILRREDEMRESLVINLPVLSEYETQKIVCKRRHKTQPQQNSSLSLCLTSYE